MMMRGIFAAILAVSVVALSVASPADAGDRRDRGYYGEGAHPKSSYYRRGPRVKGYVARRGGYSYSAADTINTYGDARGRFGSANSLRDPFIDRQTKAGPFDHGFFFDSGIAPRGGDSPYMH